MKILLAHNFYQQNGGEDSVFESECNLLEAHGHQVFKYTLHNDQLNSLSPIQSAYKSFWNHNVFDHLNTLIKQENIPIAHFHNTFPLISPAAYYAAKAAGAAVIQTIHNYRLVCPNALLFREGNPCELCIGKFFPWPGVLHGCYKNSSLTSGAVASVLSAHRLMGTWQNHVDTYIALTSFSKEKLIQGNVPAHKIAIKPNFLESDPGHSGQKQNYAVFVGRLSVEKGITTLLSAWEKLEQQIPLKIIGDGPLAEQVAHAAKTYDGIDWLGRRSPEEVFKVLREAMFMVFPSNWYEGLPRTIIESYGVGTPVIASNIGSMSSLIKDSVTGWHFMAGDSESLVEVVQKVIANPTVREKAGILARKEFELNFSAEHNYQALMNIYTKAVKTLAIQ